MAKLDTPKLIVGAIILGAALIFEFVRYLRRIWREERAKQEGGAGDDPLSAALNANRQAYDDRMEAAIANLSETDPLRVWAKRFGQVGHVTGDPLVETVMFGEGLSEPPNLPAVAVDEERRRVSLAKLPPIDYDFGVDLSNLELTPRHFMDLADHGGLAGLLLGFNGGLTPKMLPTLGRLTNLRLLELRAEDNCTPELRHLAKLVNLRVLRYGTYDVNALGQLHGLPGLTNLELCTMPFGDAQAAVFRHLPALQVLWLPTGNTLAPTGLRHVAALSRLLKLRLSTSECRGEHLRALQPLVQLQLLDLNLCSTLQASDLRELAPLLGLEELRLDNTALNQGGLEHLAPLQKLRKLSLNRAGLTDKTLLALPPLPNLEELDLQDNLITGRGLEAVGRLTKLRSLTLRGTPLADEGLRYLQSLPALEILDLGRTKVTRACGQYLSQIPRLVDLILILTALTQEEAEAVAASLQTPGQLRYSYCAEWENPLK